LTGGQGVGQFVAMIDVLLAARRLLPLLMPLSMSACAEKVVASDTAPCQLQRLAVLPYRINHGHPVVDAQIDGKPASFIFDTGAFTTILTPAAAKRLGLRQEGATSGEVIGLGGTRATRHYRANELRLGILHGEAWNFLSADILGGGPEDQPDGSLGADLLQQYDIDMDVPAHKNHPVLPAARLLAAKCFHAWRAVPDRSAEFAQRDRGLCARSAGAAADA